MIRTSKPAALAASLTLLAGAGGATVLATSASAAAPKSPDHSAPAAGSVEHGTATLSLTGPKGKTHTKSLQATCRTHNGNLLVIARPARSAKAHTAGATSASTRQRTSGAKHHARRSVGFRVRVRDAQDSASQKATVTIVRRHGATTTLRRLHTTVDLTASGGSFHWSKTLSGVKHPALKGHTTTISASWSCSTI